MNCPSPSRLFRIFIACLGGVFLVVSGFAPASGSPSADQRGDSEGEGDPASALPEWGEEDFRGGFDTRIWPEQVLRWLEAENLRDLIADPQTPESERTALRRILAMQQVWPLAHRE